MLVEIEVHAIEPKDYSDTISRLNINLFFFSYLSTGKPFTLSLSKYVTNSDDIHDR
jgi:hypothetical protein